MITLSKREKKIAREIIEKGLQIEYANALNEAFNDLQKWKDKKTDTRETYHNLFGTVRKNDKHIARRYDGMRGSDYVYVIAAQLLDGIISDDDLKEFGEQTQKSIRRMRDIYK
ncbi:MAG TPA: hypothetical protein PKA90_16915 [Ignavibacteria bacterium]|nr:hypothetical protein [Ignavibacteria bacterium]HMR42100.1 hypothetical protein [Ignavibacteria bacterium]